MVEGPIPMLTELFTYQYRPIGYSQNASDGGFKIAFFRNCRLVYTTYNRAQSVVTSSTFLIPPEVLGQYMMILDAECWWLNRQPLNIGGNNKVGYTAMVGVIGHPMFSVDDLETVAQGTPFGDERGMLVRRMTMLLENVSELLIPCGLYLTPHSFMWDSRMTGPLTNDQAAM